MRISRLVKMGAGTLAAGVFKRRMPLNVMVSVTNRCLSDCGYCNIPSRKQRELETGEIFSLIDQVRAMGCQRIGLWGGEPLLRDDIGDIIGHAKAKGLFVTVDSNGYLVPARMRVLAGLDHLVLALDGPGPVHDLNRQAGSFQKVMAAIEACAGRIPLWTITVLTRNNLGAVDFILDTARRFGFLATFQLLHHNDRLARGHRELMPGPEEYRKAIAEIIAAKKKGAPVASSFNYLYHILRWPDYAVPVSSERMGSCNCWAGRLYCNVDTDGSVYPCSLLIDKVGAMNFLQGGFQKAFDNLRTGSCRSCLASCFTEYNYMFSLNAPTILDWMRSVRKARFHAGRAPQ